MTALPVADPATELPPLDAAPGRLSAGLWVANLSAVFLPFLGLGAAAAFFWGWGFHWVDLGLLLGLYALTALGITVGFHRLFTHRSFETYRPVQLVLGVLGSMALQGPLLKWVAFHRRHHEHSDESGEPSDSRAVEALALIRTLYAVEREVKEHREKPGGTFTDADVVRLSRTRAGPILARFGDWIEGQRRSATPKSLFGQAIEYSRNQWALLVRYLDDARFAIDNGEAEHAIRPLAVGRSNWLHVGGDGGLKTAAVLLSVCGSASTRGRTSATCSINSPPVPPMPT